MVQTHPGLGEVTVFDEDWESGDGRGIRGVRNISRSDSEAARALAARVTGDCHRCVLVAIKRVKYLRNNYNNSSNATYHKL